MGRTAEPCAVLAPALCGFTATPELPKSAKRSDKPDVVGHSA